MRLLWLSLWLSSSLCLAEIPLCLAEVLERGIQFGDFYDLYSRAGYPTEAFNPPISGGAAYRLTGVINGDGSRTGVGNHYDPTGYEIDNRVPLLHFIHAGELRGNYRPAWSSMPLPSNIPHYAAVEYWGRNTAVETPSAANHSDDWDVPELKKHALSFTLQLVGKGSELFPSEPGAGPRGEFAQFYCRAKDALLICMVEYFLRDENLELRRDKIEAFLIFQR